MFAIVGSRSFISDFHVVISGRHFGASSRSSHLVVAAATLHYTFAQKTFVQLMLEFAAKSVSCAANQRKIAAKT
ncbi:hypothetical protein AMS59_16275 [Lysinibacillus sp. FJAT-14745]|nr:hypothetical protein AMS59_16275 [Lysinibacillus sp. FJAT-14745]